MNLGSPPEWVSVCANLGVFVIALTLLRGAHVRAQKGAARRRPLPDSTRSITALFM